MTSLRPPHWLLGPGIAAGILVGLAVGTGSLILQLAIAGTIFSVLLGLMVPYRILLTITLTVSFATVVQFDIAGLGLRMDMALLPSLLIAALAQKRMASISATFSYPVVPILWLWIFQQGAVSLLYAPEPSTSLRVVIWFSINLIISLLTLAEYREERAKLEQVLLLGAGATGASGILSWLYGTVTGTDFWGANSVGGFGVRAQGIAYEPNILAATCAMWILVLVTRRKGIAKHEAYILALLLGGLLLANTRAAYAALGVGIVLSLAFRPSSARRLALVAPVAALAVALLSLTAPQHIAAMAGKLTAFSFNDQASTYRFDSWRLAWGDLSQNSNWSFGLGTSSFQQRHFDPTYLDEQVGYYLGNFPLQVFYDSGVVGVLLVAFSALALAARGDFGRRTALLAAFVIISVATSPFFFSNWWVFVAVALTGGSAQRIEVLNSGSSPAAPLRERNFHAPRPATNPRVTTSTQGLSSGQLGRDAR